MRIVFVGASSFGLKAAYALSKRHDCTLAGVVTAPQKFPISYRPSGVTNVLFADMDQFSKSVNVPCRVISDGMNDAELLKEVSSWRPDCFIVVGWYHILPKTWRAVAPAYGLHASILPDYSGGAPLVWAIINGERETGITLFKFDDGVDSGPIVGCRTTPINDDDTIATLYRRIEDLGIELLLEKVPSLIGEGSIFQIQDESRRRVFPQRSPEDGVIDWSKPARQVHDFIRAQTRPYPGAFTFFNSQKLTIWCSRLPATIETSLPLRQFILRNNRVFVGCGSETAIELEMVGFSGSDMPAADFLKKIKFDSDSEFFQFD